MAGVLIAEREGFAPVVITDDAVGIVTVHDGPSLPQGEVIAPTVGRRPRRGRRPTTTTSRTRSASWPPAASAAASSRCWCEGTYYLNRLFATVELIPKTVVEVGHVGVVVSYTGATGADLSGDGLPPRRDGPARASAASGASRSCPASTRSTPTPARSSWSRPPTSSSSGSRARPATHRFDENLSEVLAHHQGRLRADPAALGGGPHRLPEGAAGHPALRRREEAGRADARPDGLGLLQEHRPDARRSSSSSRTAARSSASLVARR